MFSVSLDRSLALIIMALLVASAPVAALDLEGSVPAPGDEGADDAPRDSPLVPGAMNPQTVLEDPTADTGFQFAGDNPAAGQDADAPVDIVSLELAETDRDVVFSLKHRGYPENEATLSGAAIMNAYCDVQFTINGDANLTYGIVMDYLLPLEGSYYNWASLYRIDTEDGDPRTSNYYNRDYQLSLWTALVAEDHFEIVLPKTAILGGSDERPLRTGDRFTDFYVFCSRDTGTLFVRHVDEAEDAAGRYTITMAPSTAELSLTLPEDAPTSVAVPVGKRTKVSVEVENLLDRKLLVNLTTTVVDSDGKPLEGWTATSAPTIEMKGGATTPATVMVSVDPSVQHRQTGILRVVAFPLGFEDKATFTARVSATAPLTPEQNTLYFHRGEAFGYYCGGICIGGGGAFDEVSDPNPDVFVMNILESDPDFGREPGEDDGVALFSTDYSWAYLDAPLGAPLRFDPDGLIEFTVALKSEVAREVDFEATLWASGDSYLAYHSKTLALTEGFQTFTFSMPVNPDVVDVPRGGYIGIGMNFQETIPFISGDTWISSVEWDPSQTQLSLPLVAVPEPEVNITDGRALPSIILGNQTDKEEYVNPGETQAFDLVLLNEGTEKDTLRLTTEVSHPGWTVAFDPGNRFELAPGGSAPLCMSVAAPEDAKEGDVVNVTLTATSKLDADVKTEIDLVLLVTTGVDVEPRTCSEISEEDYVKPLTEEEDSPGIGTTLLIGAVGLMAWAARRRSA